MDWSQVIAIVLPVMLAVIIGIIYNNRRIDDLRSDMKERFSNVNRQLSNLKEEIRELRRSILSFLKKEVEV